MTKRIAGVDGYAAIEDSNTLQVDEDDLMIFPEILGKGSQGVVNKAYHRSFGNVAYKQLVTTFQLPHFNLNQQAVGNQQDRISNAQYMSVCNQRELKFTNQVDNNPYILKFLAYVIKKKPKENETDPNNSDGPKLVVGMLLEYMAQGSVSNVLAFRPEMVTMDRVRKWIPQLARALLHCHDIHNVVHRDVKVDNALLGDNYNHLKLCDFGFARNVDPGKMTGNNPKSIHSAAPETIGDNPYADYSYPCDVYSFAMFIYTVLDRMLPFMEINNKTNKVESIKVKYKPSADLLGILQAVTPVSLLTNIYLLAGYLKKHDDDAEDEFRPPIKREKWREFFCRNAFFAEQFATDLEILIWLMKECWRTNAEKRPKIKEIVDILDFHFEPPLKLDFKFDKDNTLKINILNVSYYPVAFQIRPPDQFDGKVVYSVGVSQRLLPPGHSVDLQYLPNRDLEKDTRFLIDYIRVSKEIFEELKKEVEKATDEDAVGIASLQIEFNDNELKQRNEYLIRKWAKLDPIEVSRLFEGITEDERAGRKPGRVGLITLGWPFKAQTTTNISLSN